MLSAGSQSALIDRISPDLYRTNAFRVTGLAVEANDREISRHLERLRMAQRLGTTPQETAAALLPLTPAPSVEAVSEAAQRLRDPDARLVDRFFWFWAGGGPSNDHALSLLRSGHPREAAVAWGTASQGGREPIALHNLAVVLHVTASDLECLASSRSTGALEDGHRERSWRYALKAWRMLSDLEAFWVLWEGMASSDSAMTAGLAIQFRPALPEVLLTINAQLAIAAARNGDQSRAVFHSSVLQESGFDASTIEQARRRAVQPLIHSIESLCSQSEAGATAEYTRGRDIVGRLLADAAKPLWALATILPRDHAVLVTEGDQVLETAQRGLVAYANGTHDWEGVIPLLRQCFNVPCGASTQESLKKDLGTVLGNLVGVQADAISAGATTQPHEELASLSSLASLIQDIRRSGQLSAAASAGLYDAVAQAAYTLFLGQFQSGNLVAAEQALQFGLPRAKNRATRARIEQGIATIASRRSGSSSNVAAGWIVGALILLGIISSTFDSSKKGVPTPTSGARPSAPSAQGARVSQGATAQKEENVPLWMPTGEEARRTQVAQLASEIEQGKALTSQHEQTLKLLDRSLTESSSQIEDYNAAIEQMKRQSLSFSIDRNLYELLVERQNEAVDKHNATVARRRAKYAQYQKVLRETNAKIETYNKLVR